MPTPTQTPSAPVPRIPAPVWALGAVALLVAGGASGMLVGEHLGWLGSHLPGCGPGSGCDKATNSVYGRLPVDVPGVGRWPVSFVGFTFFLSMLAAWVTQARHNRAIVVMARLGALGSVFFTVIMVMHMNQYFCKYCAVSHGANFVFWLCAEASRRAKPGVVGVRAVLTAASVFIGGTVTLGVLDRSAREARAQAAEDDLAQEIAQMQSEAAAQSAAQAQSTPPAPAAPARAYPPVDIGVPIPGDETLTREGFIGRYRLGPAQSGIRVVIFSDYQCKDCARIEKEMHEFLKGRPDILFSIKQFAFSKDCNRYYEGNMHPNACWASRAAEAAGMLRGNAGFWQMHFWLVERKTADGTETPGSFTNAELHEGLVSMGYDPEEFTRVMNSPQTLSLLQADIDEAMTLGLFSTPMIFVNGREFRAWQAPNALERYIKAVEATNPAVASATADRPLGKLDKGVEDWRQWPRTALTRVAPTFPKGPGDAKVRIVMFGDLREQFTHKLWAEIQKATADRTDVQIDFRPRPVGQACNIIGGDPASMPACRMARALEAAGRIAGSQGYWKMHAWLLGMGEKFSEARLVDGAEAVGIEYGALIRDMNSDEMLDIMIDNHKAFQRSGARGIPGLFVNERLVIRWNIDGVSIVDRIINEASQGK